MSIQSSVNQAIGSIATISALKNLKKDVKEPDNISEQLKFAQEPTIRKNILIKQQKQQQQAFERAPSQETYTPYEATTKEIQSLEQRRQKAMNKMSDIGTTKTNQRRNFREYIANLPTNWGKNVGELPESVQRKIAQQYTPYQRKKLMDETDLKLKDT